MPRIGFPSTVSSQPTCFLMISLTFNSLALDVHFVAAIFPWGGVMCRQPYSTNSCPHKYCHAIPLLCSIAVYLFIQLCVNCFYSTAYLLLFITIYIVLNYHHYYSCYCIVTVCEQTHFPRLLDVCGLASKSRLLIRPHAVF